VAGARGTHTALAPGLKFPKALMAQAPGTVVEHLSEGLLIVDPEGQLIYWNPAALKIYGFASASEAIRRLPDLPEIFELSSLDGEIIPPEEWPLARVLRGESVQDLELRVRRKTPPWTRVFRYCGSRVHYAGRRALGFLTVNDVTERKQTEVELDRVNRLNIARSLINQAIVRTTDRKGLFQQVCRVLVEKGAFRMAWVGWHSTRTNRLVPAAVWGDQTAHLRSVRIYADDRPGGRGPSGSAFRQGRAYICNDVFSDPSTLPWRGQFQQLGLAASASFPIRRAGKVRGVLTVYADEVGFFRDKEVALLEEAAADVSFALDHFASERARRRAQESAERARLFTEQYARRLQATSHRLLTVQESERRSLARELHDAVGQELTALSLNLTIIDGALPEGTAPKIHERLEDSQELLEETTRHLRNIMMELRPPGLDELGLLAALREHVGQVARRAELAVSVVGVEPQPRLPPTEEIALFRIVQEALNNIVKHAHASEAEVSLGQNSHSVVLIVTDNGVGFDTTAKPIMGGYGMGTTTMRERAEAIGAALQLQSAAGEGTRITVELSWPAQGQTGSRVE